MIRGTTPDYTLIIPGYDLTEMTVYVTIKQGNIKTTLTKPRLQIASDEEGSVIVFRLTQEETLAMKEGVADIQVRFIDSEDCALATKDGRIYVNRVLLEEVIHYADDNP